MYFKDEDLVSCPLNSFSLPSMGRYGLSTLKGSHKLAQGIALGNMKVRCGEPCKGGINLQVIHGTRHLGFSSPATRD